MRSLVATSCLLCLGLALVGGCARPTATPGVDLASLDLGLSDAPTMAAHLEVSGDLRTYAGPARLEVKSELPLHLLLEDFALAEPLEIVVEQENPVVFGKPMGDRFSDSGSFLRLEDRLLISLKRAWADGSQEDIVAVARTAPAPQAPPRDWLAPGTRLFYGLSFDDKPITRLVPMGLMVTVLDAPDGERLLAWQADVDPNAQVDDTSIRTRKGRVHVPAAVAEEGPAHSDRPPEGDLDADATSFFIPRQAARTLASMGAAAWQDRDAPGNGLLEAAGELSVTLQADDVLWTVPARAAVVSDTGATYVIADDAQDPLLISAVKPGWRIRLMAVGRPQQ